MTRLSYAQQREAELTKRATSTRIILGQRGTAYEISGRLEVHVNRRNGCFTTVVVPPQKSLRGLNQLTRHTYSLIQNGLGEEHKIKIGTRAELSGRDFTRTAQEVIYPAMKTQFGECLDALRKYHEEERGNK